MSPNPLTTTPNTRMADAEAKMQEARVQCLVVLDETQSAHAKRSWGRADFPTGTMKLTDFDYELPASAIAHHPVTRAIARVCST